MDVDADTDDEDVDDDVDDDDEYVHDFFSDALLSHDVVIQN